MKHALIAKCNDDTATMDELRELEDNDRQITYRTFAKHVDVKALAEYLGYSWGRSKKNGPVRLSTDYAVEFSKSKFRGKTCYHLDWSRVDHIFQGVEGNYY